jgi:hypothetical protein
MTSLEDRLQEFIEHEARSCSMDFGCITPEYVYRMWGGAVPLNEIEAAMDDKRRSGRKRNYERLTGNS